MSSLIATIIRIVGIMPFIAHFLANNMDFGFTGVWMEIIIANLIGSTISFTWVKMSIRTFSKESN